jgi:heme exporter protein C
MVAPKPGRWPLFGWFTVVFLVISQVVAVVISPAERDMGDLQKIMYVHFPVALNMFVCYLVVLIGSVRYLMKRDERADLLAASAAEVGAMFTGLTLVLGMLWAIDDPDRRATWSAAVGILGAFNVPIVYMSVRWWRTLHQVQSSPSTVDPLYVIGIRMNLLAVLFLVIYFIRRRYEAALTERAAEHRLEAAALGGVGNA